MSHWLKDGAKTGSEAENAGLGPNLGSPRLVTLVGDWTKATLHPERQAYPAPRLSSAR